VSTLNSRNAILLCDLQREFNRSLIDLSDWVDREGRKTRYAIAKISEWSLCKVFRRATSVQVVIIADGNPQGLLYGVESEEIRTWTEIVGVWNRGIKWYGASPMIKYYTITSTTRHKLTGYGFFFLCAFALSVSAGTFLRRRKGFSGLSRTVVRKNVNRFSAGGASHSGHDVHTHAHTRESGPFRTHFERCRGSVILAEICKAKTWDENNKIIIINISTSARSETRVKIVYDEGDLIHFLYFKCIHSRYLL